MFILFFNSSCTNFEETDSNYVYENQLNAIKIENGILTIPNKEYLQQMVASYKKDAKGRLDFNKKIIKLQNEGFKPLVPIFEGLNQNQIEEYAVRKIERINNEYIEYGLNSRDSRDFELDLDDDIISDPLIQALLNEDREIIVSDILYKYTKLGLLFIDKNSKEKIENYLNSKSPEDKNQLIHLHNTEFSTSNRPEEKFEDLGNGLTSFRMLNVPYNIHNNSGNYGDDTGGGYTGGGSNDGNIGGNGGTGSGQVVISSNSGNSGNTSNTLGDGVFDTNTFESCTIESQGFFESIFGESEACFAYYNDNRRVKVKFWNQNFFLFSSIGVKTKLQKREHFVTPFGTISWWEKSYATQIALGAKTLSYDYNFNVPAFNAQQYNYETTFFEYNGTRYNQYGQVITQVPTGVGSFAFDTESDQSILNITILGYHPNSQQLNQAVDLAVNEIGSHIQEIIQKKNSGNLKVNVINAVPFSNKVTFLVKDFKISDNNDNEIVHYFDVNFLFTWNSNYEDVGDWLQGLAGATEYTNIEADIYGAALHNNFWKGRRLYTPINQ